MVREGAIETLRYYDFPREHWRSIRTNNPMKRLLQEMKRRAQAVGNFPDGKSALMLVAARLQYMASKHWDEKRYLDMERLREMDKEVIAG